MSAQHELRGPVRPAPGLVHALKLSCDLIQLRHLVRPEMSASKILTVGYLDFTHKPGDRRVTLLCKERDQCLAQYSHPAHLAAQLATAAVPAVGGGPGAAVSHPAPFPAAALEPLSRPCLHPQADLVRGSLDWLRGNPVWFRRSLDQHNCQRCLPHHKS